MAHQDVVSTALTPEEGKLIDQLCREKGWRRSTAVRAALALAYKHKDELVSVDRERPSRRREAVAA
jgi:Protein of unknown function (DUF3489)